MHKIFKEQQKEVKVKIKVSLIFNIKKCGIVEFLSKILNNRNSTFQDTVSSRLEIAKLFLGIHYFFKNIGRPNLNL